MSDEEKQEQKTDETKQEQPVLRPATIATKLEQTNPDVPKVGTPVDVNSNITPITRQPVKDVNSLRWEKMNLAELQSQLDILERRMIYAQQSGSDEVVRQLIMGINQLRAIVSYKQENQEIKLI